MHRTQRVRPSGASVGRRWRQVTQASRRRLLRPSNRSPGACRQRAATRADGRNGVAGPGLVSRIGVDAASGRMLATVCAVTSPLLYASATSSPAVTRCAWSAASRIQSASSLRAQRGRPRARLVRSARSPAWLGQPPTDREARAPRNQARSPDGTLGRSSATGLVPQDQLADLGLDVIRVDRVRPAASGVARRPGRQRQRCRDGCEQEHADADTKTSAGGQVEGVV
jgi:hypothetical protein